MVVMVARVGCTVKICILVHLPRRGDNGGNGQPNVQRDRCTFSGIRLTCRGPSVRSSMSAERAEGRGGRGDNGGNGGKGWLHGSRFVF